MILSFFFATFIVLIIAVVSFGICKFRDMFVTRTWMVLSKYEEKDLENNVTYKVEVVNSLHSSTRLLVINKEMFDAIKFRDRVTFKNMRVLAWSKVDSIY